MATSQHCSHLRPTPMPPAYLNKTSAAADQATILTWQERQRTPSSSTLARLQPGHMYDKRIPAAIRSMPKRAAATLQASKEEDCKN